MAFSLLAIVEIYMESNRAFMISYQIFMSLVFLISSNRLGFKRIEMDADAIHCFNSVNYKYRTIAFEDILSANMHSDQLYVLINNGHALQVLRKDMKDWQLEELQAILLKRSQEIKSNSMATA